MDSTSVTLINRIRALDDQAWQSLVDLYGPLVVSWCRRGGLGSEDVADVVQEVFLQVASKIGTFRKEQPDDTFRGWLRVLTRNQVLMHFRRAGNRTPKGAGGSTAHILIHEVPDPAVPDDDTPEEISGLMLRCLDIIRTEFEERTWQAFYRSVIDDQPHDMIADELGMSMGGVRQAKYRVLKRLRQELEEA